VHTWMNAVIQTRMNSRAQLEAGCRTPLFALERLT
jgi:hypothetical protein